MLTKLSSSPSNAIACVYTMVAPWPRVLCSGPSFHFWLSHFRLQHVERDVAAVDINMGCPKRFSLQGGMGAALLKRPEVAADIVRSVLVGEGNIGTPRPKHRKDRGY